ncbi:F-type H+-transporting ATPase subunit delta [Geomicrobium halophilum]|uniref:ATP synthase subunit delta n=1 Tax=Geomicrobium halophilum TaxID=549000 RepID=A0A841PVS7_9BACL|nr:F0F1 ATP synthase subunit delta [Geomicrobium halophilum]MBB6450461.1 F-type H+-transporting ATPase subunit delta [Geomicrobium halophilum]
MSASTVANRYAKALFELAQEKGVIEQVNDELLGVQTIFESVPELQDIMAHPRMSLEKQHELLKNAFSSCHEMVMNTLLVLADRGRINIIFPLVQAFQKLSDEAFNIARAEVRAVRPLSDQEQEQIAQQFTTKVNNRRVVVTSKQDEDLIGGLVVRIGDRVYDGSVRGQLQRIERQIVSTNR